MAFNLQDEIDLDLDELFERSIHDWLGFEDFHDIFHKREDLVISNKPVQFPEEGLFLFNTMTYLADSIQWRVTKSKVMGGADEIRYKIDQCPLVPMEDGVTITYERRVYKSDNLYGAARLVHYRSYHLSDDSGEVDTREDNEDLQNLSDDDDDSNEDDDDDSGGDDSGGDDSNEDDDDDDDSDEDIEVVVPVANGYLSRFSPYQLEWVNKESCRISTKES